MKIQMKIKKKRKKMKTKEKKKTDETQALNKLNRKQLVMLTVMRRRTKGQETKIIEQSLHTR